MQYFQTYEFYFDYWIDQMIILDFDYPKKDISNNINCYGDYLNDYLEQNKKFICVLIER